MTRGIPLLLVIRWTLSIALGVVWFLIALANGSMAWRALTRKKDEQVPSLVPLVGGIVVLLTLLVCPWESPLKWLALPVALVLDVGSLPYLALALVASLSEIPRSLLRKYQESSRVSKFGIGLLGWFAIMALAEGARAAFGLDASAVEVAFWPLTVIYCVFMALLHRRLKKWRSAENGTSS